MIRDLWHCPAVPALPIVQIMTNVPDCGTTLAYRIG
jgi:hypothetical protein